MDSSPDIKTTEGAMQDKDPSRKLQLKKDGTFSVIKVRDHTVAEDVNGIYNVVLIDGVPLARTYEEASPSNTTPSPSQSDEGLHTNECPPQHSTYGKEPSKYAVSKLVDDRHQNGRTH